MLGSPTLNEESKTYTGVSAYQPSSEEKELYDVVRKAYQVGYEINHRPFEEFNGMSLIERMNEDQRSWLSWSPPPSSDPDEDWRWTGVRPITRNKIISTAAHLTQEILRPATFGQNEEDETDKYWGEVMDLLLDYNIRRSAYEQTFLYGVISGLVNPVSYLNIDYVEALQGVWEDEDAFKEVRDDELSGFQYNLIPGDEIYIDNPYQFFLQRQKNVMKVRRISYDEAEGLHGKADNWKHVEPGMKAVLGEDNLFYNIQDDLADGLVEEVRFFNRRKDCEVVFVSGIYMSNPNTEYNPFVHRTQKGKPKYPMVKFGAEPIDAMRFYFYKSFAAKMSNDQELVDRQWQMSMDAGFLKSFNPVVTIGAGKQNGSFMVPAGVTNLPANAEVIPLNSAFDPEAAFAGLREAERSAAESSSPDQLSGQSSGPQKTARESILLQQNAEANLKLVGNMAIQMVKEAGELMVDDIIRYQTVGEVAEIIGGVTKMKYPSYLVNNQVKEGHSKTAEVRFTDRLLGEEMTEDEVDMENVGLVEKAGKDRELYEVNPALFSKINFLVSSDYDVLRNRNSAFERAFKLEIYDRALVDPVIQSDPEAAMAVTRDFLLEPAVHGEASKYLPKNRKALGGLVPPAAPEGEVPQGGGNAAGGGQGIPSRLVRSVAMEKKGQLV